MKRIRTRVSKFNTQTLDAICGHLSEGKSVGTACKLVGVSQGGFYRWLSTDPAAQVAYVRAKEDAADALAELIMDAADEVMKAKTNVEVNAARVKIDSYKWLAAHMKPRRYGDRIEQVLTGNTPTPPVSVQIVYVDSKGNPAPPLRAAEALPPLPTAPDEQP